MQCSEDDGKVETFMEIDRQIQTMNMNNTNEEYENASKLRYMENNSLFHYFNRVVVCIWYSNET